MSDPGPHPAQSAEISRGPSPAICNLLGYKLAWAALVKSSSSAPTARPMHWSTKSGRSTRPDWMTPGCARRSTRMNLEIGNLDLAVNRAEAEPAAAQRLRVPPVED